MEQRDEPQGRIRVEQDGGVAWVTLDNPAVRNAMSDDMTRQWAEHMARLRRDRSVRCVVVTGEGSAFCSGGNTSWIGGEPDKSVDELRDRMEPFYRAWLSVRDLEVPTIAAINGPAVGAGLCLALACDLRHAQQGARMSVPFVRLGMHAGMAATRMLPEAIGMAAARDLLLTGRTVDADEALRLGLVTGVHEDVTASVREIAEQVAANAPIATRLTKVALRDGGHADHEAGLQWEALAQPITLATDDLQEGLAAARERRRPRFTGR
jgi:enoyl-CoA hydratase/carnithine racemase